MCGPDKFLSPETDTCICLSFYTYIDPVSGYCRACPNKYAESCDPANPEKCLSCNIFSIMSSDHKCIGCGEKNRPSNLITGYCPEPNSIILYDDKQPQITNKIFFDNQNYIDFYVKRLKNTEKSTGREFLPEIGTFGFLNLFEVWMTVDLQKDQRINIANVEYIESSALLDEEGNKKKFVRLNFSPGQLIHYKLNRKIELRPIKSDSNIPFFVKVRHRIPGTRRAATLYYIFDDEPLIMDISKSADSDQKENLLKLKEVERPSIPIQENGIDKPKEPENVGGVAV